LFGIFMSLSLNTTAITTAGSSGLHSERRSELASGAQAATITVHRILYGYAAVIAACSATQFALGAVHATYFAAMAAVTLAAGFAANVGTGTPPSKGEVGYIRWMVGVHFGLLLPPLWVLSAGYHLYYHAARAVDIAIAWVVIGSSIVAGAAIVKLKPKKKAAETSKGLV
jgi:hypothetical protein